MALAARPALNAAYDQATSRLEAAGCGVELKRFESFVDDSVAVICRHPAEALRLVRDDKAIYATYYDLIASVRLPDDGKWDRWRFAVDSVFFPGYAHAIRFASLSLTGDGLFNYGCCALVLDTAKIKRRATLFPWNTVTWFRNNEITLGSADAHIHGKCGLWDDRSKIATIKHEQGIPTCETVHDAQALILRSGESGEHDECVEVHIFGPITRKAIPMVVVDRTYAVEEDDRILLRMLEAQCAANGIKVLFR
jgi:hypothetical protein